MCAMLTNSDELVVAGLLEHELAQRLFRALDRLDVVISLCSSGSHAIVLIWLIVGAITNSVRNSAIPTST